MRKVIAIILAVVVIAAAGGYCAIWYGQASAAKNGIAQALAKINEKQQLLTYESIQTSGFPSDVVVSVIKPHFNGRIDLLLKSLSDTMPPSASPRDNARKQGFANAPEWTEDMLLDGRIDFSINAMSDHYAMRVIGNWVQNSKIKDQAIRTFSQSAGELVCTLQMGRSGGSSLWNFNALERDGKDLLSDFRQLDCANGGYVSTNPDTHDKLMSSGPSRFDITSMPQGANRQIRVYMKTVDSEITPQGDAVIAAYIYAFSPDYPFPPRYAVFGKQSMELDFTYNGPSDPKTITKDTPLDIQLSKFDITSDVYTASNTFALTNSMKGANRSARLAFNLSATFGEQYDALVQEIAHGLIKQAYAGSDPALAQLRPYIDKYTPDEMYSIIYPSIPNFHSLGKLTQALDVSFEGEPDMKAGDINLAALELSASPYGITGKGSAKMAQGRPIPVANIVLTCANCLRMVDDIVAYSGRLQKTVSYFNPEKAAAMTIDPQLVDGIKGFLGALAEPPKDAADKTTLVYTLVSDGTPAITVSGKRIDQVMSLYQEYIAPYTHKAEAPPADAAPATATAPVPPVQALPVPAPAAR